MPKKTKVNQADINIFRDAVKGVKVLNHEKIRLNKGAAEIMPRKYPDQREKEEIELNIPHFSQRDYLAKVSSDQPVMYKLIGVPHKTLRKLQKGQYNIEATLDLHGMTVVNAEIAVREFIDYCFQIGIHVGLIIHGKGLDDKAPILKNKLNHWLREIPGVIAFCSAAPKHGSHGAMYIMFKRTSRGEF